MQTVPEEMRAIVIDRFGGPEEMKVRSRPVPDVGPDDVLVRVHTADVGVWDPADREGMFAKMRGVDPSFPYGLGMGGSGTVAAVGEAVTRFREGDDVYAHGPNPDAKFYAEYAAVKADGAAPLPDGIDLEAAGAMPTDALTALCGLDDTLGVTSGESLLVFGASGGVGHLGVQLAKRMGARVLAVASGDDGVALVRRLGADAAVDGHGGDVARAVAEFAPDGLDAVLVTVNGEGLLDALAAVREGGRVAHPNGVRPEPEARPGVEVTSFNGGATPERLERLNRLIEAAPFTVHVARTFPLDEAVEAHRALEGHYLGRLALEVDRRADAG